MIVFLIKSLWKCEVIIVYCCFIILGRDVYLKERDNDRQQICLDVDDGWCFFIFIYKIFEEGV